MPSERHDKGCSAAGRRSSKTTATERSTGSDVKQQSAQAQQGRENREDPYFSYEGDSSLKCHVTQKNKKKDEAYNGQSSNPFAMFVGPTDKEAKPSASQNTDTQCPPPTTAIYKGASRGVAEDLAPSDTSSRLYTFEEYTIDMFPLGTVPSKAPRPWSKDETDRLLQMKYDDFSWKDIHAAFPDRSLESCQHRGSERWMTREAGQIRSDYRGPKGVGRVPNKRWTPAEKEVLQRLGDAGCTWDRVLEALPCRTISATRHYYASLGTREAKAEESAPGVKGTSEKRSATPIEESTTASSEKCARVVSQDIHAAGAPLFAKLDPHSTRSVQDASKEATVAEAATSAVTGLLVGKRDMDIERKTSIPPTSELAKNGRNANEQRMPRKRVNMIRWTLSDETLLSTMKGAGHSWAAISKALPNNRSERSVHSHWQEMQKGLSTPKDGRSTDERQRFRTIEGIRRPLARDF